MTGRFCRPANWLLLLALYFSLQSGPLLGLTPTVQSTPVERSGIATSEVQETAEERTVPDHLPINISTAEDGKWQVTAGTDLLTVLNVIESRGPCFYPVHAPGQVPVTRGFPLENRPGEPRDHPHHHSLWVAHGDINGSDFWTGKDVTRVGKVSVLDDPSGPSLEVDAQLFEGDKFVCNQRTRWRFEATPEWHWIECEVLHTAGQEAIEFGDTKEGFFALRVHPGLQLTAPPGQEQATGRIFNSEGQTGTAVWGRRADWVCYTGLVEAHEVSVSLFDHPANLRHPVTWHARDYGLVAANPFGLHDFEKWPTGTGRWKVEPQQTLRLRYALLLLASRFPDRDLIEKRYRVFAESQFQNPSAEKAVDRRAAPRSIR